MRRSVSRTIGGVAALPETTPSSPPTRVTPPNATFAPETLLSDRFLIETCVGRGGMGEIYRAQDLTTRMPVAIKLITRCAADDLERFTREAALLATLSHPAIVRYVAHGIAPTGNPFLAMDWLEGRDLSERLLTSPLTAAETWVLMERVCEALAAAHARGVVHRDLKPSNLFLVDDDPSAVVLLDFGVARTASTQPLTRTGMVVGTVGYMAPEQALGELDVDGRADLFSLGCVLYECLSGQPAYRARHPIAVLAKMLSGEPPHLSEHDQALAGFDALVTRLLARERSERPSDAEQLLEELRALQPLAASLADRILPLPAAVSDRERKLVTVLICRPAHERVIDGEGAECVLAHARRWLGLEPEIRVLPGQGVLVVLSEPAATLDRALQAALFSRALQLVEPDFCVALASGLAQTGARIVLGDVIDRAAELLHDAEIAEGESVADDLTADLLRARFELKQRAKHWLVGEERSAHSAQLLMGKATPCVGREKELALLDATLLECSTDRVARTVLITAAPGMGKSRLACELMARAATRRMRVLFARGDAMAMGSTLSLVQQLIASGLGLGPSASSSELRAGLQARFLSLSEPLATQHREFLAEIMGAADFAEQTRLLRAARNNPAVMSEQKRRAFARFVADLSEQAPLLFVLEDLHWGDLASVTYIDEALRETRERAITVCALARPEVYDHFPNLWSSHERQDIRLPRLTARATERLVKSVLGEAIPDDTLTRVVQLADGNAFYIEELLRRLAQGSSDLPETLLAMAQARLEQLPPSARRVLRAASTFGEHCWSGALQALLGPDSDTSYELELLLRQEILLRCEVSRFVGQPEFRFRHALLFEAAYAMLTEHDRCAAHRSAAQWLLQAGEKDALVLARHYELGGEPQLAAACIARAARVALDAGDTPSMRALAQRGLALGADGQDRGELLVIVGFAQMHVEPVEARVFDEALTLLPEGAALWWLALSIATWNAALSGDPSRAAPYMNLALSSRAGDELCGPKAEAIWVAVNGLMVLQEFELAHALIAQLEAAVRAQRDECDPVCIGWLYLARSSPGLADPWIGKELLGALSDAKAGLEIMRATGLFIGIVAALEFYAIALYGVGEVEAAAKQLDEALALVAVAGSACPRGLRESTQSVRSFIACRQGALALAEPLIADLCAADDYAVALHGHAQRSELSFRRGQLLEVLATGRRYRDLKYPTADHAMASALARAHLQLGQPRQALDLARPIVQAGHKGYLAETDSDLSLSMALAQHELGDHAAALSTLRAASARIRATASQLEAAGFAHTFSSALEANARVLQLAAAWGI